VKQGRLEDFRIYVSWF